MSVYFATCREANAVKIGSSLDPHDRLSAIQIGCPLPITIEAILPGGYEEEFTFHRRFEHSRIHGEWFTICEMIEAIIAANPAPPKPEKAPRIAKARDPVIKKQKPGKVSITKQPRAAKITPGYIVPHSATTFCGQARLYERAMQEMRAARELRGLA